LFRYTWPGHDEAFVCVEHAGQLRWVAEALGLHLQLVLLQGEQFENAPPCSQIVEKKR
jgi:hypothetical protein